MNPRLLRIALVLSLLLTPWARAKNYPALPAGTPQAPAQPSGSWLQALLPKAFQTNPKLDMTVYTEMTDLGRKLPPVSPEHPASYQLDYAGFHPMGEMSATHQLPTQEEMEQLMMRVLASQGYKLVPEPAQIPDLLIVYIWGTHNRITQLDEDSPAGAEAVRRNIIERAQLVGGKKFADELNKVIDDSQRAADSAASTSRLPGFTPIMTNDLTLPVNVWEQKNPNNQFLLEQSLDDCYYVVASAYDYRAVASGKKELLWRTRMTVNAQGVALKQALPTVVMSAGPFFGHETLQSAVIQPRAVPDGTIEIGTPTVVEAPVPAPAPGEEAVGWPDTTMTGELPSSVIAGISFIGRSGGTVKTLGGFKKRHHTLPDAANATTNAFLGKICAAELNSQAETLFQKVRAGLGYKRKDVSLNVASPAAVLTAKDFVVEICYALEEADPARYEVTTILRDLRNAELARTDEFAAIFARMFGEISFAFKKSFRVEAVVDAIEALGDGDGLSVTYPSDCSECVIAVEGIAAQVRCTADALAMIFPKPGSPRELMAEFAAVRGAFGVSGELAGMIG